MRAQYSDVFTGLGKYEKEYHIEVDSKVKPVIQRCRKVPYARYDKLKGHCIEFKYYADVLKFWSYPAGLTIADPPG